MPRYANRTKDDAVRATPEQLRDAAQAAHQAYRDHVVETCEGACARLGQCSEARQLAADASAASWASWLAHERAEQGRAA